MNIDDHWLDDNELARISAQHPSTRWGAELMRGAWPKRYPTLLSSETYRGCAIVLSTLLASMWQGISVREIQRLVEGVDQSLKVSRILQAPNDQYGGASLTVVNAWTTAADLGFTAEQIAAAYESELIFAARMFVIARQRAM
jgi:hypothetical protein